MEKRANNPMHPEKRHFHVDDRAAPPAFSTLTAADAYPDDLATFCDSEAGQEALLNGALAIGHAPSIAAALGLIARVRGMSAVSAATGMKRQQLYRALSEDGNPTLDTLTRVVGALGFRLSAQREGAGAN